MATLFIRKVSATVGNCLTYGSKDKVEHGLKDDVADTILYAKNDKTGDVVFKTITSTLNCPSGGRNTIADFNNFIEKFNSVSKKRKNKKDNSKVPALAYHLTQSFDGYIPPTLAQQIGRETAEALFGKKFLVQISTHTNTDNIHNHIVFTAWGKDGKKWHDCHASMRHMREVSDRICKEHGLEILEGTKDYKLIKWKDKNGNAHFYEPTDRKNALIDKRRDGEISTDDVCSYRNTDGYSGFMSAKQTQRDIVKHDIEMMLPIATSYEHLLDLMREHLNYEIKDKKKDGDWLAHISFKSPTSESFLRDYKLDEEGFFTREFLTDFIEKQNEEKQNVSTEKPLFESRNESSHGDNADDELIIMDSYIYSDIDVSKLSPVRRVERDKDNGERIYFARGETDKPIVSRIINKDKELHNALYNGGFNSILIDEVIKRQQEQANMKKFRMKSQQEAYVAKTVQEIQDYLNALRFIERDSVYSYSKINVLIKGYWEKYSQVFETMNEVEKRLSGRERLLKYPEELQRVLERMEVGKNEFQYMENEFEIDKMRAEKLKYLLDKYYPKTETKIAGMKESIVAFRQKADELNAKLMKYKNRLNECEHCVSVLREIDSANASAYENLWVEYDKIESAGKDMESDNKKEQNRNKRGMVR